MQRRLPYISKIRKLIGYEVTLDLRQTIERVVNYYRKKLERGIEIPVQSGS